MKQYRKRQARKIYARLDGMVQSGINSCITLWAKAKMANDEVGAAGWDGRIAGTLSCLNDLEILSIQEMLLVREYTVSQMWEKLDNMRNGAA